MIDLNKKYKQRNGLPIKILYILTKEESPDVTYPVIGLRQLHSFKWVLNTWTYEGHDASWSEPRDTDLIEIVDQEENENIIFEDK